MKLSLAPLAVFGLAIATACGSAPGGSGEEIGSNSQAVTVCAGASVVKGVDVSTYQGSVDWASVHAAGLGFAITRVSDGTTTPDDTFATNWAGIKAAGMVRGVYQFFRASQDPTAQADLLVSAVGTFESGDLPPVADVEVLDGESGATLVANLATWVSVIKSKTGRTPLIYASPGFWDDLPSTGQFAGELSWVADWGPSCPDTSTPWTTWSFWQYSDSGSVSGISGTVDVDEFNGTAAQLQALTGPAPYAAAYVSQSFPLASAALTMAEGETIPSYIELKNVGSATWDSNTKIGTTQPRDRSSVFADSKWLAPNRLARVTGTVPPGGTFKFEFDLHAPAATGTYFEYFGVVEEGVAWFSDPGQGGPPDNDLEVQVKVIAGTPKPAGDGGDTTDEPDGGTSGTTGDTPAPVLAEDGGLITAPNGATAPAGDDGGLPGGAAAGGGGHSAGGCVIAAAGGPGDSPVWVTVAGLFLGLASIRRRSRATSR